ncbi:MAG: DUF1016 N-terminal domain-containing protein [Fibromonadaceae bacterium]|jgi:hypothetical protein|nr:DUF1016 N-terminal domain-containing protein [Fibromonadaceae bacterium]
MANIAKQDNKFFAEVAELLTSARSNTYRAINSVMVETYWNIGCRIVKQEQKGKERADYGEKLIENLSRYLTGIFGKGFSEANLQNMRRFYLTFPEFPTHRVGNLAWSLYTRIMRLGNPQERDYYLQEAATENWSVSTLERNIKSGYYRRLLSSQKSVKGKENIPAIVDSTESFYLTQNIFTMEAKNASTKILPKLRDAA